MYYQLAIKHFFFFVFSFWCFSSISQNRGTDSLIQVLKTIKEDTNRVNTLNLLSKDLKDNKPDTSIILSEEAIKISEKIKWEKGICNSVRNLGTYYYLKGNLQLALQLLLRSVTLCENAIKTSGPYNKKSWVKTALSTSLGNVGLVYKAQGDYPTSLEYFFKALKIDEEIKNKKGVIRDLGSIASTYNAINQYQKALDFSFKALKINRESGDPANTINDLINIANTYFKQKVFLKALEYYNEALQIATELNKKKSVANCYGNIGLVYSSLADTVVSRAEKKEYEEKTVEYLLKGLKIKEELGNKVEIASTLGHIGYFYGERGRLQESEKYLLRALAISSETGDVDREREHHQILTRLYEDMKKPTLAFEHYKKYIVLRDKIHNDENSKKSMRAEMNFEFEKKAIADGLQNAAKLQKEELKHEQEIKQQKMYAYGGIIGFGLMIVIAAISLWANQQKKKANILITKQKEEVERTKFLVEIQKDKIEEKQKEILDSIHYAKRIQTALITSEKYFEKHLNKSK